MNAKNCSAVRPLLQRFADGELEREESSEVRFHLIDCLECRTVAGEVYKVRKFFQAPAPELAVSSGFAARVAAKAFADTSVNRESEPLIPFIRVLAGLAAAVLLVAGGFLILNKEGKSASRVEVQAATMGEIEKEIESLQKPRKSESSQKPHKPVPVSQGKNQ